MNTIRQARVYTTPILDNDGKEIGVLTFNPMDTFCLAGFRNLIAFYEVIAEKLQDVFGDKKESGPVNVDKAIEISKNRIKAFVTKKEMYAELVLVFDETFGNESAEKLFMGSVDLPTILEVLDWAFQYVDPEENKDFDQLKNRFNNLKMNRAERRAKK